MVVLSPINRLLAESLRSLQRTYVGLVTIGLRRRLLGMPNVLDTIGRLPMSLLPDALRRLGAAVGERPFLKPGLRIVAPGRDLSNLTIGDNVHFGSDVLLDLTAPITIGDDVAVGARACIITAGAGPGAGQAENARAIVIHDGALIATSAVILPGAVVGRNAVVAAQTMIDRAVAPRSIVAGSPSRVVGSVTVA